MNKFVGIVIAVIGWISSYLLLRQSLIEGNDFVTLVITSCIVGFAVAFLANISELSLGGAMLKLNSATQKAEGLVDVLQQSVLDTYKLQLSFAKRLPGGIGKITNIDPRFEDFYRIYESIVNAGFEKECSSEIHDAADKIARGQLKTISSYCNSSDELFTSPYNEKYELPRKEKLCSVILAASAIEKAAQRHDTDSQTITPFVLDSIDCYHKLFQLTEKYLA